MWQRQDREGRDRGQARLSLQDVWGKVAGVTYTAIYCEGISGAIYYSGTIDDFEQLRRAAKQRAGSAGQAALILKWGAEGKRVVLDLNRTQVIAMVEVAS